MTLKHDHEKTVKKSEESSKEHVLEENQNGLNKTSTYNLLSSKQLEYQIKSLSAPKFLGSIHLQKEMALNSSILPIQNVLNNELESKLNKSLKSTIFNPVTKILIVITLLFNILWLILTNFL